MKGMILLLVLLVVASSIHAKAPMEDSERSQFNVTALKDVKLRHVGELDLVNSGNSVKSLNHLRVNHLDVRALLPTGETLHQYTSELVKLNGYSLNDIPTFEEIRHLSPEEQKKILLSIIEDLKETVTENGERLKTPLDSDLD